MFTTLIVQPIFNLLVLIYALLPGHNFGLAIILFTLIVRLLLWPLVKRQLHQTKQMRAIQPELQRIARETKGDRARQMQMQTELYKERGINPFRAIGVSLLQAPFLLGLYVGLRKVTVDPHQMVSFAYPALQHLPWMQHLAHNIHLFDRSLFGIVDLGRSALGPQGLYWPAMLIVFASAVTQYYQAKQLSPSPKDGRSLRAIMRDAGAGKQADQTELNAAIGQSSRFFLPALIFFFTVNIPSALALYWFVGGLIAFIQQSIVLREDSDEMSALAQKQAGFGGKSGKTTRDAGSIPEAEIINKKQAADGPEVTTLPGGIKVTKTTTFTKGASSEKQKASLQNLKTGAAGGKKRRRK